MSGAMVCDAHDLEGPCYPGVEWHSDWGFSCNTDCNVSDLWVWSGVVRTDHVEFMEGMRKWRCTVGTWLSEGLYVPGLCDGHLTKFWLLPCWDGCKPKVCRCDQNHWVWLPRGSVRWLWSAQYSQWMGFRWGTNRDTPHWHHRGWWTKFKISEFSIPNIMMLNQTGHVTKLSWIFFALP